MIKFTLNKNPKNPVTREQINSTRKQIQTKEQYSIKATSRY